jgi:Spy/CpxP family protein refolding chaperone
MLERMLDKPELKARVGITEEESAKIKDSLYEARKQAIQLKAEHQVAELELRKLLDADEPNREAVNQAVEKVGNLQTQLRKVSVNERLAVREILGPEKAGKLREMGRGPVRDQMRERRGERGPGQAGPRFGEDRKGRGPRGEKGEAPWMRDKMPPPGDDE